MAIEEQTRKAAVGILVIIADTQRDMICISMQIVMCIYRSFLSS